MSFLIENWTKFYKMWSIWLAFIIAAGTWVDNLYPTLLNFLPDAWQAYAAVILAVVRLIKQKSTELDPVLKPPA
jgi:hypothetical protein